MTTMNLNQPPRTGSAEDRPVLPTDVYRMKILESKLEDDTFAKLNKDGSRPQKFALTFEITTLTEEQQEIAAERDEEWDEVRIWHRFAPYYGEVKAGGPSKFKEFLDNLVKWGLLDLNLESFDPESLCGIELKCSVAEYTKTMGENAGKPGNKITAFAPVRKASKARNAPEPTTVDEDLPF